MGKDHTAYGRARHPWLTGSAGWAYIAATHWILGVRPEYDSLVIDPCIPASWKEFEIVRLWRGARYRITVKNPDGVQKGVKSVTLNRQKASVLIPQQQPGSSNEIVVTMG
jgi:N,N'-diacetylchitobiose phosphorylase